MPKHPDQNERQYVLGWSPPESSFPGASWLRKHGMNGLAPSVQVQPSPVSRPVVRGAEPIFAVTLFDCRGNLLGGSFVASLPGDLEVPRGINLRGQDLRPYLDSGRRDWRGRAFSLVSAIWLRVKSERVRVGIYMESGPRGVSLDHLELDLAAMAAILETQMAAPAPVMARPVPSVRSSGLSELPAK